MFGLNREQLSILSGPDGGLLQEAKVSPSERERLRQIRDQMPLVARRVRHIRNATVVFCCAVGLLMLGVMAIAVAVTAGSEAFAFVALGLVLAGAAAEFAGIATLTCLAVGSSDALVYETGRTGDLG